jgi:proteasome lid subunit RPN8/RPN11
MIFITESLENIIKSEGEKCYPNECCGIIYGKLEDDGVIKVAQFIKPIENSFAENEQYHRFMITAEDMMKAELFARKNKIEIVGFYHSHPDSEAVPSEYDRNHALPVYSYIILSVEKTGTVDIKCWELDVDEKISVFNNEKMLIKEDI